MYRVLITLVGVSLLTSCARDIASDTYSGCRVGEACLTYPGTVRHARCVNVNGSDSLDQNGMGMVAGGVAGGFAGNTIGKGSGNALATVGGAIAGAVAGAVVEKKLKEQIGMEYIVELDNGDTLTIVQGPRPTLQAGQRVYVSTPPRGRARIIAQ